MTAPDSFAPGFFDRLDPSPDPVFYGPPRLVTHIDDDAIAAVGATYAELGIDGDVLDLMSSWVSHFRAAPRSLTVLGMNRAELEANTAAGERVVADLNADPVLPFADASFDDVVCCVSIDYLTQPVAVMAEVARVLRPDGRMVCTFSNRCFPTKAVRGWLTADEAARPGIVAAYFAASGAFAPAQAVRRPEARHDPLWAVWATRLSPAAAPRPG